MEIVKYNPEDVNTYPSICSDPKSVEDRFGFTGGETLLFDDRGNYIAQLIRFATTEEENATHT